MRRLVLGLLTVGLLAGAACSPPDPVRPEPTISPAGSPTSSPTSSPAVSPTAAPSPSASRTPTASPSRSTGSDDGSVEEQGGDTGGQDPSFQEAYTYSDGVRVEVTRIRHGRITAADVAAGARPKVDTSWVQLTVRVSSSKRRLTELVGDVELSYGPDKDVAAPVSVPGVHDHGLSGSIRRGRSKTTVRTFGVPRRDQDDVVLGFTPDIAHDTAYFSGSIA